MVRARFAAAAAVASLCLCAGEVLPRPIMESNMANLQPLEPVFCRTIRLGGFWRQQAKRLTEHWIPHCVAQMEAEGRGRELLNLVHAGKVLRGEPAGEYTGAPWSDAYVYNTMEAIFLALAIEARDDADLARAQDALRRKAEEWIPIILAAQMEDGYIHSYHTVGNRSRYSDTGKHEFYVQGYFIEMGVAHYLATGGTDRRLYDAARRCADHLVATFGPAPKRTWRHGHAGMEIALCRLGRLVNQTEGEERGNAYIDLVRFLYESRCTPENRGGPYNQAHLPATAQTEAAGHAVRATYFYAGMTDIAMLTGDPAYLTAVDRIWDNAVQRRMYLTGGVGSTHEGEAFGADFDLPNESAYCESCAGCGLAFWAERMHRIHRDGRAMDVHERVLYNNILGAIELGGRNFFYQNPLAAEQKRYPWHGCPCCVGNIPRALLAIKDLIYSLDPERHTLYVNHFVDGECTLPAVAGGPLRIEQRTQYPWRGEVTLILHPDAPRAFTVALRVPSRAESALYTPRPDLAGICSLRLHDGSSEAGCRDIRLERGYLAVRREWRPGDRIELTLPMEVQRVHADSRVTADRGLVALQRGPLVYNLEDADHEGQAQSLVLPPGEPLAAAWREDLLGGVMALTRADGTVLAVPNYARLNRGGWSQVWTAEDPAALPIWLLRPDLASRTVDRVDIGREASEQAHGRRGETTGSGTFRGRRWRDARNGGWFSYELTLDAEAGNSLLCTYWGSDTGNRRFDILVNGTAIAEQTLENARPGEFFDVEYPLPDPSARDRTRITVRFQAKPGAMAGGIFDLRILRRLP
ncbi:MAG: glycoside hydrolase family 127 protein [Lentisphaeria bacterium]|nr:glycoside hydrolase family 127 protein [Lentisphaeria bacterium]